MKGWAVKLYRSARPTDRSFEKFYHGSVGGLLLNSGYNHSMAALRKDRSPFIIVWLAILITLWGLSPAGDDTRQAFHQAEMARQAGAPQRAAVHLAFLAERIPWRTELWEIAGHYALAGGQPDLAGAYFAAAAQRGALSLNGYLAWGEADWQAGQPETAVQVWQLAYKLGADPYVSLSQLASAYRALGDQSGLIETLQNLLGITTMLPASERASLLAELGLQLSVNEPAKAPPYLLQAIELNRALEATLRPLNFAIQRALSQQDAAFTLLAAGRVLANQGEWDLAAIAFENAITAQPNYAEAWAYAAEAWQQLSQAEKSLFALEHALALNPDSLAANSFMALYWQRQGDYIQAQAYLQAAQQADPDNPHLLTDLGNLIALQGDLQTAQDHYQQAIALAPNDPDFVQAWIEFSVRYNLDLKATALPAARQAVLRYPDSAGMLDAMGQVLYQLGDQFNAERFFRRALQIDPDYSQAHLHLGIVHVFRDQAAPARSHLETVLRLAPGSPQAIQAQRLLDNFP